MNPPSYNHLYGVMRSRETELLDGGQLRALSSMRVVTELPQIVGDSLFLRRFSEAYDEASLEAAVELELTQLQSLIAQHAPESALRDLVLVPLDLYNIKGALRVWASDKASNDEASLYGLPGTRSLERIREAVAGAGASIASAGDLDPASRVLAAAVEGGLAAFYQSGRSGQALELALDRLSRLFQVAQSAPASPEVSLVLSAEAEIAAAELVVRGVAGGLPWQTVRWGLLEMPGLLDIEEVFGLRREEWPARLGAFSGEFKRLLAAVAEGQNAGSALRTAQQRVSTAILGWLFWPPSFAFAYAYARKKLDDLANLRLICLAKLRGLADVEIEQRVRRGMVRVGA